MLVLLFICALYYLVSTETREGHAPCPCQVSGSKIAMLFENMSNYIPFFSKQGKCRNYVSSTNAWNTQSGAIHTVSAVLLYSMT